MNNLLEFIERHKYGIIIALFVHLILFLYLQLRTYQELVVYEPWSYRYKGKESPDDIIIDAEDILLADEDAISELFEQEQITSFVTRADDKREKELVEGERYTSYEGDAYSNVRAFEQEVIQKLESKRAERDREEGTSEAVDLKGDKGDQGEHQSEAGPSAGSTKAAAGKTMVTYELSNRKPFNNNDWHVRNPGYTCGNVNGTVTVSITVAQSGDVIAARYIPEKSQNADACMIRQAEKYAKMSRFNYDGNAPRTQEGTIQYLFVFRQ